MSEFSSSVTQQHYDRKMSHREEELVVCWIADKLIYLWSGFDSNFCRFLTGRDGCYSLLATPSEESIMALWSEIHIKHDIPSLPSSK